MSEIFISYAHDDKAVAHRFAAALEAGGHSVWWDDTLRSGETFDEAIESALRAAKAVVVLWSPRSVASRWVRAEATLADRLGTFLPVRIAPCELPVIFELTHTADLSAWKGKTSDPAWQRFAAEVSRHLAGERAADAHAPWPAAVHLPHLSRRKAMVLAGGAALAGGGLVAWQAGMFGGGARANSIAVLPFRNLSGDKDQDYFAQGIASEIRNALSRNAALRVAAEKSSEAASESKDDARTIASRLGVAYLMSGDVRLAGKALRASIDLTDGKTGFSRFAKSFEQPMGDALAIQTAIADAVTLALTDEIATAGGKPLSGGTANASAFDNYLRGRDLYMKAPDRAGEEAALARFDAAIAIDPKFAAAHAARARSLIAIGNEYGSVEECRLLYAAAAKSADEAARLAPDMAEAQSTLGLVLSQGLLKMREARAPYERSYALGGGEAPVMGRYALYAANIGDSAKAIEAIGRAQALDPINPLVRRGKGQILFYDGRYREAIAAIEEGLALDRGMAFSRSIIGDALLMLGQVREARDAYALEPNAILGVTGLAIAEHRLGNAAAANAARKRVDTGLGANQLTTYQQAQIAAQWGEPDKAMDALHKGFAALDSGLGYTLRDPLLAPLRKRPDFLQLLSRLGFA